MGVQVQQPGHGELRAAGGGRVPGQGPAGEDQAGGAGGEQEAGQEEARQLCNPSPQLSRKDERIRELLVDNEQQMEEHQTLMQAGPMEQGDDCLVYLPG